MGAEGEEGFQTFGVYQSSGEPSHVLCEGGVVVGDLARIVALQGRDCLQNEASPRPVQQHTHTHTHTQHPLIQNPPLSSPLPPSLPPSLSPLTPSHNLCSDQATFRGFHDCVKHIFLAAVCQFHGCAN